jgi:hypothetical protein
MSTEANKRVLGEFDAVLGADDLTPLDRLCRADMINHAVAPDRPAGLAGTREFLQIMGRHQMTPRGLAWPCRDRRGRLHRAIRCQTRTLARRTLHGHRRLAGDYSSGFAAMYRLQDCQIAERWAVRDDLTMLRQLGALPAD